MKPTKAVVYAKGPTYLLGPYQSFGPYYIKPLLPNGMPAEGRAHKHPDAFISLDHLAIYLLENDLEAIKLPNEEGWGDVQDLDDAHWENLTALLTGEPLKP